MFRPWQIHNPKSRHRYFFAVKVIKTITSDITNSLFGYAIHRTSIALSSLEAGLKQQEQQQRHFQLPQLMMPTSLRLCHVISQTFKPFSNIIHPHYGLLAVNTTNKRKKQHSH
jgi:hypothetical protein